MGAGIDQKGALGQQLAASGRARRAEKIRREGKGRSPIPGGKGRARAVIEDRMDQNDKEGKQKQGKPGRPGSRPPVMRPSPIEGGDQPFPGFPDKKPFPPKEGRPFEPPKETYDPPKGDRPPRPVPPKEGRPIGDDQFPPRGGKPFPGFPGEGFLPGRPPGGRPGKPFPPRDGDVRIQPFPYPGRPIRGKDQFGPGDIPGKPPFGGRPPVEEHPWGKENDPNYAKKKDAWHQRRMEGKKKGGIEFGPGRGSRIPEGQVGLFGKVGGAGGLQDFLARMAQLRGGGIK
tara:strand:+ start:65 stop:922 length:858 start_codon:yes stop_codon:yes gene_type:complete